MNWVTTSMEVINEVETDEAETSGELVLAPYPTTVEGELNVLVKVALGQSVIVRVVASMTVYIAPLVEKVVGPGQKVVKWVTTSVEVDIVFETVAVVIVSVTCDVCITAALVVEENLDDVERA
ncbi:uncharacterized protein ZBIST_5061 [Zygosaccharomyces bailii]|nr:uncharacterized protein ZBIST_5061 [Zygosaccharomyces bailii]